MARVRDILAARRAPVETVLPTATVHVAIERLVERNIGSVVVSDGTRVVGIFTERDVLRRVALPALDSRRARVGEVMTADPITIDPEATIEACMELMTRERIRHLPVVEAGRLAGMISIGDLVKYLGEAREAEVEQLTRYIQSPPPLPRPAP